MVTGRIIRRTNNGAQVAFIETDQIGLAMSDCIALGISRDVIDCVVVMIGENDDGAGQGAAYSARLIQTLDMIERAFPNARIVLQDIVSTADAEYLTVRAGNVAAVALRNTRRLSAITSITLSDTTHYNLAGYAQAGANQIAAYAGAS